MNTSNIAGALDKTSYRAGGYTSGTATECVPQVARPASQVETQLAALATESEQMLKVVEEIEARLYLVLRPACPEGNEKQDRPALVGHAETLLGIRGKFGCAYSRLNSILERLEA